MFSQRNQQLQKLACFAVLFAVLTSTVANAQVTFSRDWNAGKRSLAEAGPPTADCAAIWRSINSLCAAVTKNIHHLTICEARSLLKNIQADDVSMENTGGNNVPLFSSNRV
ncbi:adipokinetic hormone/corazonin-related peptide-like isoform X2 [Malaya genurostris]|uniref:adipokinetic hormone/corazonin-related peptide-like isoform X2 n=1 Tax=Malaya genurostris TaxID=325434 RepID=UPI0026F3F153|nr:adipokinetic hormone/corazonin-related peptide-like isoform X2 [Malaya genurostris]